MDELFIEVDDTSDIGFQLSNTPHLGGKDYWKTTILD